MVCSSNCLEQVEHPLESFQALENKKNLAIFKATLLAFEPVTTKLMLKVF